MNVEGIGKNIFNIIDATYYIGKHAEVTLSSDARGGQYAKVFGPNQTILDTGWSTMNAWLGQHEINVRWFTDTAAYYGAILEYWVKDDLGNITLTHPTELHFMNDVSDEYGNGAGTAYFNENYQYKMIVKSHPSVAANEYVAVDYINIVPVDPKSIKAGSLYAGTNGSQKTPTVRGFYITVSGDGTSFKYSTTYTVPLDLTSIYFHPMVCVYGNAVGKYKVDFSSYSGDTITVTVAHVDGTTWIGEIVVSCILYLHEDTISLGGIV
jgi:hypothetical protein